MNLERAGAILDLHDAAEWDFLVAEAREEQMRLLQAIKGSGEHERDKGRLEILDEYFGDPLLGQDRTGSILAMRARDAIKTEEAKHHGKKGRS